MNSAVYLQYNNIIIVFRSSYCSVLINVRMSTAQGFNKVLLTHLLKERNIQPHDID